MAYQPIEKYGIIGDLHTVALVGPDASIDWMCLPRVDSPSVFGAILDQQRGGRFRITPADLSGVTQKQFYWPDTNVLVTRFLSPDGVGDVTDYMPMGRKSARGQHQLIRQVKAARGTMTFTVECSPAFNYARDPHQVEVRAGGATFHSASLALEIETQVPLVANDRGGVTAEVTLQESQSASFVLEPLQPGQPLAEPLSEQEATELFQSTVDYWRRWLAGCTYSGRWREMVHRSALVLKLLTYAPTGAIVAAPTCSLPEHVGGVRNWDYRYTWIRDAAFTLYALIRVGFTDEARGFMGWLEARCAESALDRIGPSGPLQLMYGVDGRRRLDVETLDHLEGYRGSRPVRVGNDAYQQLQMDIYGELMDAVYLANKYSTPISYDLWRHLRRMVDWVCDNWQQPDEGIWEVRSGRQHFVYSKLMCWVAVDRGLRLADRRSFPADRSRWLACRDAIYEELLSRGWNRERQAFVQSYDSTSLDAANLILPLVFFMSPTDPRMLGTLDAINRSPAEGGLVSNSLVYRYDADTSPDGLAGREGTFSMCTFWLVEALTRAGRGDPARLEQARLMFEQMLGFANHLGLYAEQIGSSGEALGNFPQAFTHLSLISAAVNLDRALGQTRSRAGG